MVTLKCGKRLSFEDKTHDHENGFRADLAAIALLIEWHVLFLMSGSNL